jgi:hypothetical protein
VEEIPLLAGLVIAAALMRRMYNIDISVSRSTMIASNDTDKREQLRARTGGAVAVFHINP